MVKTCGVESASDVVGFVRQLSTGKNLSEEVNLILKTNYVF